MTMFHNLFVFSKQTDRWTPHWHVLHVLNTTMAFMCILLNVLNWIYHHDDLEIGLEVLIGLYALWPLIPFISLCEFGCEAQPSGVQRQQWYVIVFTTSVFWYCGILTVFLLVSPSHPEGLFIYIVITNIIPVVPTCQVLVEYIQDKTSRQQPLILSTPTSYQYMGDIESDTSSIST